MDFDCFGSCLFVMVNINIGSKKGQEIKGKIDPATSRREEKRRRSPR